MSFCPGLCLDKKLAISNFWTRESRLAVYGIYRVPRQGREEGTVSMTGKDQAAKGQSFFRRGAVALIAAATMASSLPVAAIAATADGAHTATAAVQAAADAVQLGEIGKTYEINAYYRKDGSTEQSMSAGYFSSTAQVTRTAKDTYQVSFSSKLTEDQKGWISDVTVDGAAAQAVANEDGINYTYTFTTSDIEKTFDVSMKVQPMGGGEVALDLYLDTKPIPSVQDVDFSALNAAIADAKAVEQGTKTDEAFAALQDAVAAAQAVADNSEATQDQVDAAVTALQQAVADFNASGDATVDPKPEAREMSYQIYYQGADATSQYVGRSFKDKVQVTKNGDGSYTVDLTANSLGDAATLGDVTYDGKIVPSTENADGSKTYFLILPSIDATYDFTFSYTITSAGRTNVHPFQLVLEGGTYTGYSTDQATLTSVISKAQRKLDSSKKEDAANEALRDAIAAAQKVADDASSDGKAYGDAVVALNAAIKTFDASADKAETPDPEPEPEQGALEVGKTYNVPVSYLKDGSTEQSMSAGYLSSSAQVTRTDENTYKVVFSTNLTADQKGWISDVTVDGTAVEVSEDGNNLVFTFTTSDIEKTFDVTMKVQPMGGNEVSLDMKLAVDKATEGELPAEKADKSELLAAIEEAKKIEQGTKSDSAFAALQDAIATAQAVADDDSASQATVDSAVSTLKGAVEAFNRSADKATGTVTPTTPGTTTGTKTPTASGTKTPTATAAASKTLPKTGDATSVASVIATALSGLGLTGAGAFLRNRKRH